MSDLSQNLTNETTNQACDQSMTQEQLANLKNFGAKRALASINCPVELAIRIIGGKWKPVIIWHLREEKKRFGELKKEIKGITVKMLAQQLRELEQDGLVSRKMYYEVPPRVEYSLTELARELEPALNELAAWGKKYRALAVQQSLPKVPDTETKHVSDNTSNS